ncbi:cytochrome c peroxidase [Gimesia maris]|uniref:cytochrome c peroxidase n=1 Tax=Gimesia maris TaxID=122 RepID=UPI0021BC73C2|nr:cytochrome c peroxidase [Gimesia maris]
MLGCLTVFAGCQQSQRPETNSDTTTDTSTVIPTHVQAKALAARDALFTRLSGRLSEVIQAKGPVAAIEVCSREAAEIAKSVSEEQGVRIGRTAIKLRNPKNAPLDWVQPLVDQRTTEPRFVALPNGESGALLPIKLKSKCLICHGTSDTIPAVVKTKLAELYPHDQATGFRQGDLRGWFWVVVPAEKQADDSAFHNVSGDEILAADNLESGTKQIQKPYTHSQTGVKPSDDTSRLKFTGAVNVPSLSGQLPSTVADPDDNPTTPAKVELGKKLFFDPRLSLTGTISCNSCHNLMEGGDDGRPSSMGVHGRIGPRNAPTVWNSAFQTTQFWDGRAVDLEEQATGPIVAQPEMGMPDHVTVIERLATIPGYRAEFAKVFGGKEPVTIKNVARAIAAFERTLITPNSPYDQYLGGDQSALTTNQVRGMQLFDATGCTECHSGPALNGWEADRTEPAFHEFPRFTESDFIVRYNLDKDLGRSQFTQSIEDQHYFKVPTLRNIAITAPYFHNGAVESLSEAVRVMAEVELDVKLTDEEVSDIVAFLTDLEGEFPVITMPRIPSRSGQSILEDQAPAKANE